MGRGAWWATVHRVTKSQTQLKRLNTHTHRALSETLITALRVLIYIGPFSLMTTKAYIVININVQCALCLLTLNLHKTLK